MAHFFTFLNGATGLVLLVLFAGYHSTHKQVHLAVEPAGLATIAALVSHSEFVRELRPTDSEKMIEDKVKAARYKLRPQGGIEVIFDDDARHA